MCLISSYTEIEKKDQIVKVLNLIKSPINTEAERQHLLYNLAYMNDMVVKGYMKERTDMDERIYYVKDLALDYIVKQMPERCFLSDDNGYYVIYVCVNSRQYSFHTRSNHGMKYNFKRDIREPRWDGIIGGWKLSDAEYKQQMENRRKDKHRKDALHAEWERDYGRAVRLATIRQIKKTRERNREVRRQKGARDRWWKTLEDGLNSRQKNTVAFKTRDAKKCYKLYGKKMGMEWPPCVGIYYSEPCPYVSPSGICPGYQDVNGHSVYDNEIRGYYEVIKDKLPKYKI